MLSDSTVTWSYVFHLLSLTTVLCPDFPTARGREFDDDIIYWETVDKARLPEHLLNRFHILFCMSELQREKACLKSLLAEERRRQMLAELSGRAVLSVPGSLLR